MVSDTRTFRKFNLIAAPASGSVSRPACWVCPGALVWKVPLFLLLTLCRHSAGTELGTDEYQLPLIGKYAVLRYGPEHGPDTFGKHVLVTSSNPGWGWEGVIGNLKKVAVTGTMIVGTTDNEFFILDTSEQYPAPQMFADAEHWHAALKSANIPTNIQLNDPDTMAASMNERQIHPSKYARMHGRLGFTDDGWSALTILAGLAFMFLCGLLGQWKRLLPLALLCGFTVNVIAEILLGDGPGAFPGFVVFPILCLIAGTVGEMLRRPVRRVLGWPLV